MIGIGLTGFGYWGPNLARNFSVLPDCRLVAVCDKDKAQTARAAAMYPACKVTEDYRELVENPEINAILIATPVSTHFQLAKDALEAGKDVLLEKPLTRTSAEARELIAIAKKKKLILAVDHTFIYTGAVRKMKQIVESGELGGIIYIDSVRVNLGLFQQDVNVIYDLAPHDISIVCHLLGRDPISVQAAGACHEGSDMEYLAYIHLEYEDNLIAHFHLNWLSPVKVRRMMIAGANKMIVYDDMEPSEKVKVYDKGIEVRKGDLNSLYKVYVDCRTGDMVAPKLEQREALRVEAEHFLACIRNRTAPLTDAQAGLTVARIIEAAHISIRTKGARIELEKI